MTFETKPQNLKKRFIAVIIGIPPFIGLIFWNQWGYFGLLLIINLLMLNEFYKITSVSKSIPLNMIGIISGISIYTFSFLVNINFISIINIVYLIILIPIIFCIGIFEKPIKESFSRIAFCILGIIYIILPFSMLHYIVFIDNEYSYGIILTLFFLTWASDIGAYFIGKLIGKIKLFERVSPKKTWEGAIGGILISMIVGFILSNFVDFKMSNWLIVSPIVSISGIFGDLSASLLKRSVNVKDTGNLIPGHGGFLDRFDSILISIPFMLVLFKLLQ